MSVWGGGKVYDLRGFIASSNVPETDSVIYWDDAEKGGVWRAVGAKAGCVQAKGGDDAICKHCLEGFACDCFEGVCKDLVGDVGVDGSSGWEEDRRALGEGFEKA